MTEPFWIWCPQPGAMRATELKVDQSDYGDGYIHRSTRGLNPLRPKWSVSFPFVDLDVLDAMRDFLETNAAPGFYFKPPDEDIPEVFVYADTWSATVIDRAGNGNRVGQLTAEFVRCYNPQPLGVGTSLFAAVPIAPTTTVALVDGVPVGVTDAPAPPPPIPQPNPNIPRQPTRSLR